MAPLIYSIHNTGQPTTKVALVPHLNYQEVILQLSAVHSGLKAYIKPEHHKAVFVEGKEVCISGQTADTISSCSYSAYADRLLGEYNPQDGEAGSTAPVPT